MAAQLRCVDMAVRVLRSGIWYGGAWWLDSVDSFGVVYGKVLSVTECMQRVNEWCVLYGSGSVCVCVFVCLFVSTVYLCLVEVCRVAASAV